eukprot:TRINITY_DN2235_c0_g1_i1.p2 TRINITY_DN2235_c0_g1~~TRINITY_DN2235_c0_g1_i1.p2  ORF type:complete len:87 (-),score=3.86 TRINITY_DN2235_c0_g1_i1:200-460(-)
MVNIILAIGFAIDNAAHVCHAFMHGKGQRRERAVHALNVMAVPVMQGDVCTIIALSSLFTSKSQIFLSFFKCLTLVMLFGMAHAVL